MSYIVWREHGKQSTKKHNYVGGARDEAVRLAMENSNVRFLVYELVEVGYAQFTPTFIDTRDKGKL